METNSNIKSSDSDQDQASNVEESIETSRILSGEIASLATENKTAISSSSQSLKCNDTNDPDKTIAGPSCFQSEIPSCLKPLTAECSSKLPETPDIVSGFDSADSTNDEDFLSTQKAVLSAINFMDEGLENQVESSTDNCSADENRGNKIISNNECKALFDDKSDNKASNEGKKGLESGISKENLVITRNSEAADSATSRISENNDSKVANLETSQSTLDVTCENKNKSDDLDEVIVPSEKTVSPDEEKVIESVFPASVEIPDVDMSKYDDTNETKSSITGTNDNLCDEMDLNTNSKYKSEKIKDEDMLSKERTSFDDQSDNKASIEDFDDKAEASENNSEVEDSTNKQISENVDVEAMELELSQPILDIKIEKDCKTDVLDEIIMLDENKTDSPNSKKVIESVLPVSVEISDVEVSVFRFERNKNEKSIKNEEFKLDDMVLSSDEDSDQSENVKGDFTDTIDTSKNTSNITADLSMDTETNLALELTEQSDGHGLEKNKISEEIEQPKITPPKISEIEVMDVENNSLIQEDCSKKIEEESTKMDLEGAVDSSEKVVLSTEPKDSQCQENESTNLDSSECQEIKTASSPQNIDNKDDHQSNSNDLPAKLPKSNDSEERDANESNFVDKETDLENMLKTALSNNEKFRENLSLESSEGNNKNSSEITSSKEADVICLVDDDDDETNQKKKPAAAFNCVNPSCMSGEDLAPPAMFVLSYFGLKRSKGQQVCAECFNTVIEHQEVQSLLLKERKPVLSAVFPSHKDVILLDSDDESISDNESDLSDDTMSVIRESLDDVIAESLAKYDFDFQLQESCNILNNRLAKLEEEASEITKRYDDVQHSLDAFRKQIYEEFQQETREKEEIHFTECEIPPMPIIKSKLQNQLYNKELMHRLRYLHEKESNKEVEELTGPPTRTIATKKVSQASQAQTYVVENLTQDVTFVRMEAKYEPPPNLPPPGPLARPKLRVGDLAYTMKVSYFSIWVHCRIIEVIPRNPTENDPSTETYRVKLENVKKNAVRTVTGKYLAYPTPAKVQLKVGVRVIAIFKEEDESAATKDNYYVGVIAEPPKSTNKYRYLVFFDDGYTQYCPHNNVLVVCSTSKHVWEDIHPEPRDFIKNYLQQYPERPMVKLSQGQIVKVEWNGRWWIVRVLEVDGSLVKVHFDADKRTEWIYRGSTRLGPMYQELAAAKERQTGSLLRSRGFGGGAHHRSDMPYVEYTRGDGDGDNENKPEEKDKAEETAEEQTPAPRSVARKSTAKKPPEQNLQIANNTYCKPLINHVPEGRLRQRKLRPKCRPINFRPHQCSEACVAWTGHTPAAAKKYDPLVKPLMFGFERLLGNFKGKTIVQYRAPCGRMIRTQQEMLCYLRGTKSQLTIDLFDFDFWVNPLNEFEEGNTFGKIEDLSYGKENVRISCVNELDHSMPQYVQYMTARQPANDVNLNLDPEFLVGCDCTDDCEDRSKCSCWQLTLQGKAYVPDGDLDPLFGYQYRRLPERIATGIYECNSRCKCSMTCQNRVAQQPLSCRLQLFKTLKKGWGIRCLHDIPRGAFICIYAGFLLTEQEANEGGKTYGDEYLAELDYIESVENLKEGYESEAREPSDLDDDDVSQKDTMDIEYEHSADSDVEVEQGSSARPGDIRSKAVPAPPPPTLDPLPWALRLRRRTVDEAEKESRKSKADDDAISISDDELDSGLCGGCRESLENVKDTLRCQGCVKSYHFKCTPLKTSANVDKLGANKSSWVCSKCEALVRKPKTFDANITVNEGEDGEIRYPSVRELYGPDENVYIMDAKTHGNIGRYLNHSCSPNVFVQNVFVDTHDLRFPWVAFFANQYIPAGTELTWDYNYDVGSVPGKVMLCYCGSNHCRGRLL